MFILKLGAEALSLKNGTADCKNKDASSLSSDISSNGSLNSISETNGNMLENLLNGYSVESALLSSDNVKIKRCQSAHSYSKSSYIQSVKQPENEARYRPRSDTLPENLSQQNISNVRKRKYDLMNDQTSSFPKSILYDYLTKSSDKSNFRISFPLTTASDTRINSLTNSAHINFPCHSLFTSGSGSPKLLASFETDDRKSEAIISSSEMKLLRQQINSLLKKIMFIIKQYTNYSSVSESRRLDFVSQMWYRLFVLFLIQMDPDVGRSMFRWLLLSICNDKLENGFSRRDQILLLDRLQDYMRTYFWIKSNTELYNCLLFWFLGQYGYPDLFCMSQQTIMTKLKTLLTDNNQVHSICTLIHDVIDLKESHMRHLFCQHLPSDSSMADFLVQWT